MSRINQEILDFEMIDQQKSYWCWAATAQSVAKFYDEESNWIQCDIAAKTINREGHNCCNGEPCNTPWELPPALDVTGNSNGFIEEPIPWEKLVEELSNDRLVCALIEWTSSDGDSRIGHFVTIYGFVEVKDGLQLVYVEDPSTNQGFQFIPFQEFQTNYISQSFGDRGRWIQTFLTIG